MRIEGVMIQLRIMKKLPNSELLKNPWHFLSLGFGSGLLPFMPGTWGTVAAIPVYLIICWLPTNYYLLIVALATIFGFWLCGHTARALETHDHPSIVWDEIVGYLLTMTAVPIKWNWIVLGFILFRIFDIWKPWPIKWVDNRIRNGIGIVLDDLLAGVYAWLLLHFIILSCG